MWKFAVKIVFGLVVSTTRPNSIIWVNFVPASGETPMRKPTEKKRHLPGLPSGETTSLQQALAVSQLVTKAAQKSINLLAASG